MENYDSLFTKKKSTFSKENFREKKQQERTLVFAMLEEATRAVAESPEALTDYLDTQSRYDRFSVSNCLLISKQNNRTLELHDYDGWREKNVQVLKGQTGILIMGHGKEYEKEDGSTGRNMNVTRVFDISQTSAAENGVDVHTPNIRVLLKDLMAESPVNVCIANDLADGVMGAYSREENAILLRPGMEGEEIFRTLAFEIVTVKQEQKFEESPFRATCAAYMICAKFNIGTDDFVFDNAVEHFEGMEPKEVRAELEKIKTSANEISQNIIRALESRSKAAQAKTR